MSSVLGRDAAVDEALHRLQRFAVADEPLAGCTTYRVGGAAAVFATPCSVDELREVGATARATGLEVLVVGRGSNMLVADEGFRGIAVSLARIGAEIELDGTAVRAGAAVVLPVLARRTAAAGLTGCEWAVGVPGSVGGAVRMNAGGHGSDIAACLVTARIVDLRTGEDAIWPAADIGLRFRGSGLEDHHVVLSAELQLAAGRVRESEAMIAEIVRWRREHQPG
ncbi:MAG: murB, partial [Ilumatobacteraceae bacterium]|nr:murB [Ilumatobacteraceae bacterium]